MLLWATIALAYLLTLQAFPAPVHGLPPATPSCSWASAIAGSALPIPGGGGAWAGNVFALTKPASGMPGELAASAGLMLWLVTTMAIIPAGLIFAQIDGISLGQVARRSEAAEQDAAAA